MLGPATGGSGPGVEVGVSRRCAGGKGVGVRTGSGSGVGFFSGLCDMGVLV